MHTKKTYNTKKLMQINYHSALTKIQKLQNLKKKKKFFFVPPDTPDNGRYCPKLAGMASIRPVFFPIWNRGVIRTSLLAGTVYSGRYSTELTPLVKTQGKYFPLSPRAGSILKGFHSPTSTLNLYLNPQNTYWKYIHKCTAKSHSNL